MSNEDHLPGPDKERRVVDGASYFAHLVRMEATCEEQTRHWFDRAGDRAPETRAALLNAIALLDGAASCYWGCDRKDHTVRYITGRATGLAASSLRLLEMGHYDESISLTRSIGEIVNLLFLFAQQPASFDEWKAADKKERLGSFSPYKVRVRLESLSGLLPMTPERYALMSETAAHVTPQTLPQAYNLHGVPTLGAYFQPPGALVCLNELGYATALVSMASLKLIKLPRDAHADLYDRAKELYESVGQLDLATLPLLWQAMRTSTDDAPAT